MADTLIAFEETFLADLTLLRDVFINMVQRETVVPPPMQEELWGGFGALFDAQCTFLNALKGGGKRSCVQGEELELMTDCML